MRSAAKHATPKRASSRPPAKKRRRGKKNHALVLPKFEVLPDGAHAVTIPVHTECFVNGSQGFSKGAKFAEARAKKAQRDALAYHFFGIGLEFRGVTMVRLAPQNWRKGLDTGNLWNALKGIQDEIAEHLGIDDGPLSPASWEVDQEASPVYGVRVELRKERAKSKAENASAWAAMARLRLLSAKFRSLGLEDVANDVEEAMRGAA